MCGITGLWTTGRFDKRALAAMAGKLAHRGPDDEGFWTDQDAGIGFGHRRLSILDLSSAGHQPMLSACGRYVLSFNGEIYNHSDLRRELENTGEHPWRGHSDTETLLAAITRWGIRRALQMSVGMFALSLWDRSERMLTLARDRIGEKPLYYGWSGSGFIFGSELKALVACPGFDAEVNRTALNQFVRRSYIPVPLSIYNDVFKLEQGCLLQLDRDSIGRRPQGFNGWPISLPSLQLEPYWSYGDAVERGRRDPVVTEAEAGDELERLLIQAVRQQSIADVPVGTFLSGGYDSSTIAAVQQHHSSSRVSTFTIGFDELGFDESPHARAVAAHLGTEHHEMRVTAADALALIPTLPIIYDEPFADSSQIPTHLLSRLTRRHVKVALSGDGGDELFGGYNRFIFFEQYRRRLVRSPAALRRAAAGLIRAIGTERLDQLAACFGVSIPQVGLKAQKLAALLMEGDRLPALYDRLLSQWDTAAGVVLGAVPANGWPKEVPVHGAGDAVQMMLWDATGYLPDDILVKTDRASMATSLETRAPYLDHRIVEFVARIPLDMKIREDGGKWILRQLLYNYVPRELLDRPKAGFCIPLGQWLRGPLRDWAEELLRRERLEDEGYFDARLVLGHWATHLSGRRDYSSALWPILMFQSWLESDPMQTRSLAVAAE